MNHRIANAQELLQDAAGIMLEALEAVKEILERERPTVRIDTAIAIATCAIEEARGEA